METIMKDGYYLSVYADIHPLGNLLNLTGRHDQNISLWHKQGKYVELIHVWEFERISGNKQFARYFYDPDHIVCLINKLLYPYNLTIHDMVEVWGTPFISTTNDYHSINDLPDLQYHSIAHLFSAIMLDTDIFDHGNILAFAPDGLPDTSLDKGYYNKPFYAGCYSEKGSVKYFPIFSPGLLWDMASARFKLREGTLMALASSCNNRMPVPVHGDFMISDFASAEHVRKNVIRLFDWIDENYKAEGEETFNPLFSLEENKISIAMKEIQRISFEIMEHNIEEQLSRFSIDPNTTYLAMAGGFALNCPTNSHLLNKYGFRGFIAPPCPNDAGMSLGIALYAFHKKAGKICFRLKNAYYGNKDEKSQNLITHPYYSKHIKDMQDFETYKAVEDVKNAPIVWFNGNAEIGPRALGNRSILADPRNQAVKDELNRIKGRQWWRPVAPIVIEDYADEWFERWTSSKYMLNTFLIKTEKQSLIPAVSHLDQSARVQTMDESDGNDLLFRLLKAFYQDTDVPILCNTSLNDKGEPIIDTIEQALNFALRKGIQVIYINGKRVELCCHSQFEENKPTARETIQPLIEPEEYERLITMYNPHGLSNETIQAYMPMFQHGEYDLTNPKDVRRIRLKNIIR